MLDEGQRMVSIVTGQNLKSLYSTRCIFSDMYLYGHAVSNW